MSSKTDIAFYVGFKTTVGALKGDQRNLLGPFFKQLREQKKLTQSEMVKQLQLTAGWQVTRQIYEFLELGERGITDAELFAILYVLGATPSILEAPFKDFCATLRKRPKRG